MRGFIERLRDSGLLLALALAPLLVVLFETTSLDRSLVALYFDASSHAFPLRDDALLQGVMHGGMKFLVIGIAFAVFGAFLLTYLLPPWRPHRRRLLWILAGMAGGSLLVALLKHGSTMHCPWDLAEYGGYAPFHGLFERLPDGTSPGRCFPGGHASGGFALLAFYFGLRDAHLRAARLCLPAALALGAVMGWTQMMRGAHFLSHNVWAGWLVWTYLAVLYAAFPPFRAPQDGAPVIPL